MNHLCHYNYSLRFLNNKLCPSFSSKLYVWHLNGFLFLSATSRSYTDHVNHWPLHIPSVFDYSCRCPVTTQIQVICYTWHKLIPSRHLLMKPLLKYLKEIDYPFIYKAFIKKDHKIFKSKCVSHNDYKLTVGLPF